MPAPLAQFCLTAAQIDVGMSEGSSSCMHTCGVRELEDVLHQIKLTNADSKCTPACTSCKDEVRMVLCGCAAWAAWAQAVLLDTTREKQRTMGSTAFQMGRGCHSSSASVPQRQSQIQLSGCSCWMRDTCGETGRRRFRLCHLELL